MGTKQSARIHHRPQDISRFQPNTPTARSQVDFLVQRGAVITQVRAGQVTLKRGVQTATVDSWGRVEWAH